MHSPSDARLPWAAKPFVVAAVVAALGLSACSGSGAPSSAAGGANRAPVPSTAAPKAAAGSGQATAGADRAPSAVPTAGPRRDFTLTDPAKDPLSTFALDIDTGSYTRARDALSSGREVSPSEVRTEEFVNYFEQDYQAPADGLDVAVDGATLPIGQGRRIVRVGVRSADVDERNRSDANLALVVDCSGSMADANKMPMTKAALGTLARSLRPTDRVAIVCYSTTAQVLLAPTPASEREAILGAIEGLHPQASTNVEAGLDLGYQQARAMQGAGRMTRVVLVSDGVANVGGTSPEAILGRIGSAAREGISLISIGVGITGYNDRLLEQLADKGEGWHAYVDSQAEADRLFGTGLASALVVTARQAKAQVQFDPSQVAGYRLLGYENRAVADRDFRNDAVDGGEIFAGHSSTALYEVALRSDAGDKPLLTATVRYADPNGKVVERQRSLAADQTTAPVAQASKRLHQDVVVALLADQLMRGPWSSQTSVGDLRAQANVLGARLPEDKDVLELIRLIGKLPA